MNDAHSDSLPPGHPASTDPPISAGAVLSGRGQGAGGGSLGPMARSEVGGESSSAPIEGGRRAGDKHDVDVVVIGSHERGWFSRVFSGSVEQDLMRTGDFSVLIVK